MGIASGTAIDSVAGKENIRLIYAKASAWERQVRRFRLSSALGFECWSLG